MASCPQSWRQFRGYTWTHKGLSSSFQHHELGREKGGPGKFLYPFPSAPSDRASCGFVIRGRRCSILVEIQVMPSQRGCGQNLALSRQDPIRWICLGWTMKGVLWRRKLWLEAPSVQTRTSSSTRAWIICPLSPLTLENPAETIWEAGWGRPPIACGKDSPEDSRPRLLAWEGPNTEPTWKACHLQRHKSPGISTHSPHKLWFWFIWSAIIQAALYSNSNYFQLQNEGAWAASYPLLELRAVLMRGGGVRSPPGFPGVLRISGSKKGSLWAVVEVLGSQLFRQFCKPYSVFRLLNVVENVLLILREFALIWVTSSTVKSKRGQKRVVWS